MRAPHLLWSLLLLLTVVPQNGIVQGGIVQGGIVQGNIVLSGIVQSGIVQGDIVQSSESPGETELRPNPTYYPAADRIVAIGDLHGDLAATRKVFKMMRLTNGLDQWAAGNTVVVQTGDQLDRGDDEQAILEFLERMQREASEAGGAVHILNGNHELMNVRLDLRYVTPGGFADFEDAVSYDPNDPSLKEYPVEQRARVAAFRPGGKYAKMLARNNVAIVIGDNLFVHGGILPEHLEMGLEELNLAVRRWMLGDGPVPEGIHEADSPVWARTFSDDPGPDECAMLNEVLDSLGVKRMIVGHTVQKQGVTPRCRGRVWCIDVGLAEHYGGPIAALEIRGSDVQGESVPRRMPGPKKK